MTGRLQPGGSLGSGQGLAPANRRALLTMQGDGNLVLYEYFASGRRAYLWDSATAGNPGATAHLRADGDLVVLRRDGHVLWEAGTAGTGPAELVLQDDGDLVLRGPGEQRAWASGTRLAYARVGFRPDRHGFASPDAFADEAAGDASTGDVTTRGCGGGLVFAALDHWYAGEPVPDRTPPVAGSRWSAPDDRLARYVRERTLDSLRAGSAVRFAEWSVHADEETWLYPGVDRWCRRDELPRLVDGLRAGRPVPLGLVGARSLATPGDNHQVVAYGFEDDRTTGRTTVMVHDSEHPGIEVHLVAERRVLGWISSTGARWRGFFVQDYTPRTPPPQQHRVPSEGPVAGSRVPGLHHARAVAATGWGDVGEDPEATTSGSSVTERSGVAVLEPA